MLYNTSKVINLTKKELLDTIDELEVFTHFMGFKPLIGQTYISPLRNDKSPSFSLFWGKNGHLLYKDFGTGKSGDCIEFVKQLTHQSTREVTKELTDLFTSNNIKRPLKRKRVKKVPENSTDIQIKKMDFNEEGLSYWKSFGIDLETLNKYEVYQVKKVWINGDLKVSYTKGNPIFAYIIYDRIKIYQPLNRDNRFFTNCNRYYIQGWKQLNKSNETLIITKSLKDVMLLDKLGYSAIAPNAESYTIPDIIITEINKTFDNIIVLYDRDVAGVVNARKLVKSHNFDFRFINKKYKVKDVSDFYKKYGKVQTKKLLSNLINK